MVLVEIIIALRRSVWASLSESGECPVDFGRVWDEVVDLIRWSPQEDGSIVAEVSVTVELEVFGKRSPI
ncbi:unnamed protein product [Anisakis simplex]|uniref:Dihydroneopterin aldolase n=1 Tax=Anisakis simplex TaxID=6269 RepID=A0A0M3J0U6_ANISI|nr:unnamed protein product [Anisakis simplex]